MGAGELERLLLRAQEDKERETATLQGRVRSLEQALEEAQLGILAQAGGAVGSSMRGIEEESPGGGGVGIGNPGDDETPSAAVARQRALEIQTLRRQMGDMQTAFDRGEELERALEGELEGLRAKVRSLEAVRVQQEAELARTGDELRKLQTEAELREDASVQGAVAAASNAASVTALAEERYLAYIDELERQIAELQQVFQ